jgi:dTDP-4-amino-4,6-dideoxygalactose transaminase
MSLHETPPKIEFIDLAAQRRRLGPALDAAIRAAIEGGQYILGPQVAQFERDLAAFAGVRHAVGLANGTDAIGLSLLACGVRAGDAVICPSFTFAATAEAVAWIGATPVFVDIDAATYNLDPASLARALDLCAREKLTPRAVIAVDLFGQTADYDAIEAFCAAHGLTLICDSAQGFGATYKGRRTGQMGKVTTASFFPAKPLGCYGDGGAIVTDDDGLADLVRSLRFHGKGSDKYDNVRIGMNSRLDTLQAAILSQKLSIFEEEIAARQVVARRYAEGLADVATVPVVLERCVSVWAQYVIRVGAQARDGFMAALKAKGVPSAVYYPRPLHLQTAYARFPVVGNGLPVSETAAREVVALPMHPYLDAPTQAHIVAAAREALGARS